MIKTFVARAFELRVAQIKTFSAHPRIFQDAQGQPNPERDLMRSQTMNEELTERDALCYTGVRGIFFGSLSSAWYHKNLYNNNVFQKQA
jgi:hypothetical protein